MHTSNFRKVKRVEDTIYIYQKVKEKVACKLLLIGDGPERDGLERLCRELKMCDDIRFLGKQDAIEELLSIADLFLIPSASESFGLAALEAMACEVPVISSNIGGLPEVNIQGVTGFLSDVGDIEQMSKNAIELLTDEQMLNQFKKNALAQAKKFDITNILPEYESYYETIIKNSK